MACFYSLTMVSGNSKTGPIPVSTSHRGTCPPACTLKGSGCYAEYHNLRTHWDRLTRGMQRSAEGWVEFLESVRKIRPSALWRHNQAGDLVGETNYLNANAAVDLALANKGRKGFTYTHYPVIGDFSPEILEHNRAVIKTMNDMGFTVNLSADNLTQADEMYDLGIGPVVTILPTEKGAVTAKGRRVIVCPAVTRNQQCSSCGLCQKRNRKSIIGFPVHGTGKKMALRAAGQ